MIGLVQEQGATAEFFSTITVTYLVVCGLWFASARLFGDAWPRGADVPPSDRRWLDLGVTAIVAVGVLGLGQLMSSGLLLPRASGGLGMLTFNVNTLIVYSPLLIALIVRRQPASTVLLAPRRPVASVLVGSALALVGLGVYLALASELHRFGPVVLEACGIHALSHFIPVFLEAVAVGFLYVRLRWVCGEIPSLLVPCLLFAVGHLRRSIDSGRPPAEIAAFFVLNTLLPFAIFFTVVRSREVIWIGVVHYLLDVAIGAFDG